MRKLATLIALALAALLLASAYGAGEQPAATPVPTATTAPTAGPTATIAFGSTRDGNLDIYVMNADGSGLTRLTDNPAFDFAPAWSPDGSRIAFVSFRDGNGEIYVMNADGSGLTRLTDTPAWDLEPDWSSDGSRIAFASGPQRKHEVYVMNADGSNQTNLTDDPGDDCYPAWSPALAGLPSSGGAPGPANGDADWWPLALGAAALAGGGLSILTWRLRRQPP